MKPCQAKVILATLSLIAAFGCSEQKFAVQAKAEEFGQSVTYTRKVDILWVIDTSSSMAVHQDRLSSQVGLFVSALNDTGLDYQMAVTTMDMSSTGAKGKFIANQGEPAILGSQLTNLSTILASRLRVGQDGSPLERGLQSMKAALSSPLTLNSNKGFLRQDSLLVVIFLSNEDDQSIADDYEGFLNTTRPPLPLGGRSWIAQFLGSVPNEPSCQAAEWGYQSYGTAYINLAELSGGVAEAICDGDLRRALTNVKARVLEVLTAWQLDKKPIVSSIVVKVDDVVVPQSETNGWTYDESANVIRFHGDSVPKAGSKIKVEFDPSFS